MADVSPARYRANLSRARAKALRRRDLGLGCAVSTI
jgi:hypothetical protein